ncbi:hypothetical protein, partial [Sporosalibacterium faouarense]|uniref:hypothetical protein n=1 Tax=Sporosalibacterium faouarense TaxID=516123 RepID=UPI0024358FC0
MKRTKFKKITSYFLVMAIIFTMIPINTAEAATTGNWQDVGNVAGSFAGGSGTQGDPYQISSAEELARLASLVNAGDAAYNSVYYELTQDIDLSAHEWTPIGIGTNQFKGHFDGKGYVVSNVNIGTSDTPETTYIRLGLFGYISRGEIKNTGVNASIVSSKASAEIGSLAGENYHGTISNSYATGYVEGGSSQEVVVGGLVGMNNYGTISNSFTTATVKGGSGAYVGGFLGRYFGGTITNVYYNSDQASEGIGFNNNYTATAKTTAEMQSQAFVDTLNLNRSGHPDWNAWEAVVNDYPALVTPTPATALNVTVSPGTATGSTK